MKRIKLDQEINIEEPDFGRDRLGAETVDWQLSFSPWANIEFHVGNEAVRSDQVQSRQGALVTIRNSEAARRITRKWQIKHRGLVYKIQEPPRISDDRRFIQFTTEGAG